MEEWRDVPGFPNFQVTADGRIMAKAFINENAVNRWGDKRTRRYRARELSPVINCSNGYLRVSSLRQKSRPKVYVHRMVALAWVDGYADGLHVNHKNGIKTDNRAENLEWVTNAENIKHAWDTGLCKNFLENASNCKLTGDQVIAIRAAGALGLSPTLIAKIANMSRAGIQKILDNKTWSRLKSPIS
jgi:hypothetical protein